MSDDIRQLYLRWINELWSGSAHAGDLVADTFVGHWPDRTARGPGELQAMIDGTRAMFTSITFTVEEGPFVDGDVVVGRWRGRGETPDGPTEFVGHDILRVSGDEFVEFWVVSAPAESPA
jgi:hypothetical protein